MLTDIAARRRSAVATLRTTQPGQAALGIVRDNDDALLKLLAKCHFFVDRGEMQCFAGFGLATGLLLTMATPLDHVLATIAALPA